MALAGFDDIPLARFVSPGLTTVRVPMQEMAVLAMERIFERMEGKAVRGRRHRTLRTEVIVRASCGVRLRRRSRGRSVGIRPSEQEEGG
jgi:LacI family transcriptional regulator